MLQWAVRIVTAVFERVSDVFVQRRIPEDPDADWCECYVVLVAVLVLECLFA